jgi:nucleotide-binding universal stress UspA family protein
LNRNEDGVITLEAILCPVDASEVSRGALGYAIALATQYSARLRVLEVVSHPSLPAAIAPSAVTGLTVEMRKTLVEELEKLVQPALAAGVATDVRLEEGYVVAEILEGGRAFAADLIVMGTHGRSGFDRIVLGSVTEKVLRKADCPVLTVPPLSRHAADKPIRFRCILCAVDFSEPSTTAVDYAASFASHAGARLVLINILDWPVTDAGPADARVPMLDTFRREWEVKAAEELRKAVPAETRRGAQVEEIVAIGKPSREILRVAAEVGADLIVMGGHGRGALERAMLGSTAHYVVRHAVCPVLTVRAKT